MAVNEDLDFEIDNDFKPDVEVKRSGRPGWAAVVEQVAALPTGLLKNTDPGYRDEFAGIDVGPLAVFPKRDAKGNRERSITYQTYDTQRKKFGKGSDFHKENGYYMYIDLSHRAVETPEGKRSPVTKGYLVMRRVDQPYEPPKAK